MFIRQIKKKIYYLADLHSSLLRLVQIPNFSKHFSPTPTKHSGTLSSHGNLLSLQSHSTIQIYKDFSGPSFEEIFLKLSSFINSGFRKVFDGVTPEAHLQLTVKFYLGDKLNKGIKDYLDTCAWVKPGAVLQIPLSFIKWLPESLSDWLVLPSGGVASKRVCYQQGYPVFTESAPRWIKYISRYVLLLAFTKILGPKDQLQKDSLHKINERATIRTCQEVQCLPNARIFVKMETKKVWINYSYCQSMIKCKGWPGIDNHLQKRRHILWKVRSSSIETRAKPGMGPTVLATLQTEDSHTTD